jgi:cobalt/nickel transport system permease protein
MKIEEFSQGESLIHCLNPRIKMVVALVFSVVVALSQSITACAASLIFPNILIVVAGLPMRKVLSRMAAVNVFMVFLWLFLPFTYPGTVVYSIGPLEAHREGILFALLITLKSNAIVLTLVALLGTSSVFDLVHALSHMGVPIKLVHLFFFCFRYIHVIRDEYLRLVQALKIRNFRPGTNMHSYRTYGYLVGMLLVRSFDRSKRIMAAMKCRGFNGNFYILHHYNMKRNDYFMACSSTAFALLLLIMP